jgi:hypothetical protein
LKEKCACGRTIVVPSLDELRRRAGLREHGLAPEQVVETLLLAGRLPEEDHCVLCGVPTQETICCITECERAYIKSGRHSWLTYLDGFLTLGSLGVTIVTALREKDREMGKDRTFPLPLRACSACGQRLIGPAELKAALCRVPVYRALLEKYPESRLTLSGS